MRYKIHNLFDWNLNSYNSEKFPGIHLECRMDCFPLMLVWGTYMHQHYLFKRLLGTIHELANSKSEIQIVNYVLHQTEADAIELDCGSWSVPCTYVSVLGPEKVVLLIAYSDYGYEVNNCQHKNISIDGLIHHSQPLISAGPRNNIVPS